MKQKEEFLTYFREIQVKFSRFYTKILTELDLTLPQFALLNELASQGEICMTEVGAKLFITKPAVTHLVDQLEMGSFLKREKHPNDRRCYYLIIQPKGKKAVQKIQEHIFKYLFNVLDQFDEMERHSIVKFYALIAHTMDEFLNKKVETVRE